MKKHFKIAISLAAFTVIFSAAIAYFALPVIAGTFKLCREQAACGAMETGLMVELDGYYHEYGRYPDSLDQIDMQTCLSDGATEEMFRKVKYQSHGVTCQFEYEREVAEILVTWTFKEGEFEVEHLRLE